MNAARRMAEATVRGAWRRERDLVWRAMTGELGEAELDRLGLAAMQAGNGFRYTVAAARAVDAGCFACGGVGVIALRRGGTRPCSCFFRGVFGGVLEHWARLQQVKSAARRLSDSVWIAAVERMAARRLKGEYRQAIEGVLKGEDRAATAATMGIGRARLYRLEARAAEWMGRMAVEDARPIWPLERWYAEWRG